MKSIGFKQRLGGAVLGISIIFGMGLTDGLRAQAQSQNDGYYGQDQNRDRDGRGRRRRGRDWDLYGRWGGSFELRQTALNAGYNEGIKEGRKDSRKGKPFGFYDKKEFKKATKDYSSRLGDKELYRRYFREGYENGYTDGFNGY